MASLGKIARRTFLLGAAAIAGGVAVGYWYYRQPYPNPLEGELKDGEATFNPYVKIAADNTITVIAPRAEMGQGISTTLAALVAEELDVDLASVKVEHGPASYAYYNSAMIEEGGPFSFFDEGMLAELFRDSMGVVGKFLGLHGTGGSASTRDAFDKMRQAGAATRMLLVEAAARKLGVPASELVAKNGTIAHAASGRSVTYGEVAADAGTVEPSSSVTLRDKAQWRLLGKPQKRVDMLAKVTGAPIFGVDVREPDMLYGTVKMSPRLWAKPAKASLSKAESMPGVVKIVPIETTYGSGFGVIAENSWAAFRAADAIEVEWGAADYPAESAGISELLRSTAANGDGSALRDDGDVDEAFADAPRERLVEADYAVPFLAHACMEPMNATARLKDGVLDLWSPNQIPTITRLLCAELAGVEREQVNVHTTFMGGGFGRRGEMDFSMFATLLAKEVPGKPVKVTWTREEDTRHDVYRPAAAGKFRARLGADGMPVAVDMRIASPSVIASVLKRAFPSFSSVGPDKTISEGAHDQPYTIKDYRVTAIEADLAIPVGFWRSVGNSYNGFFHESFLDEVAAAGKVDPVAMRRRLMADYPAALAVIDKVAAMSNWGEALPAGKAKGIAFTLSFGSWVAEVVQIADTPAGIRIEKVWIAADVGTALDPGIIEAQLTSGAIFGLSAAMMQEVTFADGMVEQSNFHDYDAMRMHQAPEFEVAILENYHKMGGVGEIGTPPAAPALANAIFALTGKRIRSLPLNKEVAFGMNGLARLLAVVAFALLAPAAAIAQETQPAAPADTAAGLVEWEKIFAVFSHPRCANCHVADDRPRWSGAHYGPVPRMHGFNVQRGADGSGFGNPGLRCTTCHFNGNSDVLHGPPGAENWHLAPVEMVWWEKSSAEICAQIKDPARNGGRSMEEVAVHVRDDRLVGWGWAPGPGREPAPGSAQATFEALRRWAAAGSPCPSN